MKILVSWASKYGSTEEIARHLADAFRAAGFEVDATPVKEARGLERYDAFVIGSALYFGKWLKGATAFVRENAAALASKPTWLFSSGPLGTDRVDKDGKDILESAEPAELPELKNLTRPRGHQVFFGKVDAKKLSLFARLVRAMPEGRKLIPEGDFRQWEAIDQFAVDIARELAEGIRPRSSDLEAAAPAP